MPGNLRKDILAIMHDHPISGHRGRDSTLDKIRERYFWPTIRTDTITYVKTCETCQKYKSRNTKVPGFLHSIPVSDMQPMSTIGIDLQGPLPLSTKRNRFLCVIVDYATRYSELFPLKSSTTKNITQCLVKFIGRHGSPKHIISDRGSQFVSRIYLEFCKACFIKPKHTSPFHPQTNLTERINRMIKTHIAMYVGNAHNHWDDFLDFIQLAINSSKSQSSGFSPYYLCTGVSPNLPWDNLDSSFHEPPEDMDNLPPYVQNVIRARNFAKQNFETAQKRQAVNYNKRHKDEVLSKDSLVLRQSHKKSNAQIGVTKKLFEKFEGPFKIVECLGNLNYLLMNPLTNKLAGVWHVSQLKLFHERNPDPGPTHIASNTSTARVNPVVDCPSPVVTDSVNTTDALPISGNVSPAHVNMQPSLVSDPFHLPFKMGWFREVVTRKDSNKQKQQPVDVYYYSPKPHFKQFRSDQDIKRNLSTDGLSSKNFCWKPIAIYHEPQELIRQAGDPTVKKLYSRV